MLIDSRCKRFIVGPQRSHESLVFLPPVSVTYLSLFPRSTRVSALTNIFVNITSQYAKRNENKSIIWNKIVSHEIKVEKNIPNSKFPTRKYAKNIFHLTFLSMADSCSTRALTCPCVSKRNFLENGDSWEKCYSLLIFTLGTDFHCVTSPLPCA